ncbi:MAG: dinitrogenase iron-molybdenum cofactor biosynthesis protein [Candidatus Cloacimonadota bacterium]|nr:MAG: dinitrogenase iron-molybdenum cofactor biosynthesis protein [Candidatus Cloacimonadota bacterium]PIE78241.1 MAG: dinitrogenase iron-molybdenum cofactor biosynthesis protein [Candidatus Delongbacteria bacterium]
MNIAICTTGESLDSNLDERFGRCENFLIYNSETEKFTVVKNRAKDEASGAGRNAVKQLSENGVDLVLAPHIGPKGLTALEAMEIEAYDFGDSKSVEDAINNFKAGILEKVTNRKGGLRKV